MASYRGPRTSAPCASRFGSVTSKYVRASASFSGWGGTATPASVAISLQRSWKWRTSRPCVEPADSRKYPASRQLKQVSSVWLPADASRLATWSASVVFPDPAGPTTAARWRLVR